MVYYINFLEIHPVDVPVLQTVSSTFITNFINPTDVPAVLPESQALYIEDP